MNSFASTILLLALAIAGGAAIYFIYQEIQQEKRRLEAVSQHIRRLESLVWTYNIRPSAHDDQTETEQEYIEDQEDDDDEQQHNTREQHIAPNTQEQQNDDDNLNENEDEDDNHNEDENRDHGHVSFFPMPMATTVFFGSAPTSRTQQPPIIEEIVEDDDIPIVVSFDSNENTKNDDTNENENETENENNDEQKTNTGGSGGSRVYADTAKNRRLGRVGKSY